MKLSKINEYKTLGAILIWLLKVSVDGLLSIYWDTFMHNILEVPICLIVLIFHSGFARWRYRNAVFSEANMGYARMGTETLTPWFVGIKNC